MYPHNQWLFSSSRRFLLRADHLPMWTVDLNLNAAWALKVLLNLIITFIKGNHLPEPGGHLNPTCATFLLNRTWCVHLTAQLVLGVEGGVTWGCVVSLCYKPHYPCFRSETWAYCLVLSIPRYFSILSVRWTQICSALPGSGLILTHSLAHFFWEGFEPGIGFNTVSYFDRTSFARTKDSQEYSSGRIQPSLA